MKTISDIINEIIKIEGGYVNDSADMGGPTKYGITLATLKLVKPNATIDDVKNLKKEDAYKIYEDLYFKKPNLDKVYSIAPELAGKLLDISINMGATIAGSFLQTVLNAFNDGYYQDLKVDGSIGNMTINALNAFILKRGKSGETALLKAVNCLQGNRYINIALGNASQRKFIFGWISNRIS